MFRKDEAGFYDNDEGPAAYMTEVVSHTPKVDKLLRKVMNLIPNLIMMCFGAEYVHGAPSE